MWHKKDFYSQLIFCTLYRYFIEKNHSEGAMRNCRRKNLPIYSPLVHSIPKRTNLTKLKTDPFHSLGPRITFTQVLMLSIPKDCDFNALYLNFLCLWIDPFPFGEFDFGHFSRRQFDGSSLTRQPKKPYAHFFSSLRIYPGMHF